MPGAPIVSFPNPVLSPEISPPQMVLLYEDVLVGKRAMGIWQNFLDGLESRYEFHYHLWSFKVLQLHQVFEASAQLTAGANVILVSARGDAPLPRLIQNWIERWIALRERRPGALVGMLAESDPERLAGSSIQADLKAAAQRARMDFFLHLPRNGSDSRARVESPATTGREFWAQSMARKSLEAVQQNIPAYMHGGLND